MKFFIIKSLAWKKFRKLYFCMYHIFALPECQLAFKFFSTFTKNIGMKSIEFWHEEMHTQQKHKDMCKKQVKLQLFCVFNLIQQSTIVLHIVFWTKKHLKQNLLMIHKSFIKKIKIHYKSAYSFQGKKMLKSF